MTNTQKPEQSLGPSPWQEIIDELNPQTVKQALTRFYGMRPTATMSAPENRMPWESFNRDPQSNANVSHDSWRRAYEGLYFRFCRFVEQRVQDGPVEPLARELLGITVEHYPHITRQEQMFQELFRLSEEAIAAKREAACIRAALLRALNRDLSKNDLLRCMEEILKTTTPEPHLAGTPIVPKDFNSSLEKPDGEKT